MATTVVHLTDRPPRTQKGDRIHAGHLLDIETARELVATCGRRPWSGDETTIRITSAHRVSDQVWNVLLKVIEEPPDYVRWHIYAPSSDPLPRTIKSRAHVIRESTPDPSGEDASRLIRLIESHDALALIREADRHTDAADARRAVEAIWTHGIRQRNLTQAILAQRSLTRLRRSGNVRVIMKGLLLELAQRHVQEQAAV